MYFHGAPSSRLDLQIGGVDEQLAARGIRVVSPNRPGYGGSSPQPARAMSNWASDVGVLADHLGIDRFAVFGLSGGPYAVAIAALLGLRIIGRGVIAGAADVAWVPAWEDYDETEVALMRTGSEDEAIARCQHKFGFDGAGLLSGGTYELSDADLALFDDEAMASGFMATTTEALRQGVVGFAQDIWLQGRPWTFDPARIVARCHVLHGEADTIVPVRHAQHTAAVPPGASLVTLPGHGHLRSSPRPPRSFNCLSPPRERRIELVALPTIEADLTLRRIWRTRWVRSGGGVQRTATRARFEPSAQPEACA